MTFLGELGETKSIQDHSAIGFFAKNDENRSIFDQVIANHKCGRLF